MDDNSSYPLRGLFSGVFLLLLSFHLITYYSFRQAQPVYVMTMKMTTTGQTPYQTTTTRGSRCVCLPQPVFAPLISDNEPEHQIQAQSTTTVVTHAVVPAYGQQNGWRPTSLEDFGVYPMFVSFFYSSELALRWWRCIPQMSYCTISFRHGHKESVWYNLCPSEHIFKLL